MYDWELVSHLGGVAKGFPDIVGHAGGRRMFLMADLTALLSSRGNLL